MSRPRRPIALACFGLLALAVFLGGMLAATLLEARDTQAQARMLATHDGLTFLTAQTREQEDSLFVLDNASGVLMVYRVDARNQLVVGGRFDLREVFGPGAQ